MKTRNKKTKAKKFLQTFMAALILLLIWQIAAMAVNRSLIVPTPLQVAEQMIAQLKSPKFFSQVEATVVRVLESLLLSFASGFALAFAAFFCRRAAPFLNRTVSILQTVPTISYLIVFLFWTGRTATVLAVVFFLLFPVVYRIVYGQLQEFEERWKDVWKIYPQPKSVIFFTICLPEMKGTLASVLDSASAMAFKSCAMAEVLAGVSSGIGKGMQSARMDLNMAGVLAWSAWLVLLVFAFEILWKILIRFLYSEKR
jgi:NitT/TauT family transport system permease protein